MAELGFESEIWLHSLDMQPLRCSHIVEGTGKGLAVCGGVLGQTCPDSHHTSWRSLSLLPNGRNQEWNPAQKSPNLHVISLGCCPVFLTRSAQLLPPPFDYSKHILSLENVLETQETCMKWDAEDPCEASFLSAAFVKTIASQLGPHPFNEFINIAHAFTGYRVSAIIHANVGSRDRQILSRA